MNEERGLIFNIQRFCANDGPGIRTTVFFKGCPLHCLWCHNPESQEPKIEIGYFAEKCIGCTACAAACQKQCHRFENGIHIFDRANCDRCGRCTEKCVGALTRIGEEKTVIEVFDEVLRDRAFFESSGGGLTLSGGEPMMQFPFALSLLRKAKEENIHTCLETCGEALWEQFAAVLPYTDLFLYDFKESDFTLHRTFTGVGNERILENLAKLNEKGAAICLRVPIIPQYNDRPQHFRAIGEIANRFANIREVQVEPFHPLGLEKCRVIGRNDDFSERDFPPEEKTKEWIKSIQDFTDRPVKKA